LRYLESWLIVYLAQWAAAHIIKAVRQCYADNLSKNDLGIISHLIMCNNLRTINTASVRTQTLRAAYIFNNIPNCLREL